MRIHYILKYIGICLLLEALFMLVSAAISAYCGMDGSFLPLLYSGALTGILGAFPSIFVRSQGKISSKEGYYIVAGAWISCCIMGAAPYVMSGYDFSFTDAIFESVSGFTTTGASILDDIESLPRGLLFWRMSTAWIGGIGIVALFSLVIPSANGISSILTGVEVSDIARSSSNMRQQSFVHTMIGTYVVLTAAAVIALKAGGMNWFDAVTHAMSACSTCGFSTKNTSIAAFDSPLIETILIFFMMVSSIRFTLLSGVLHKGGLRVLASSEVTRVFIGMTAFLAVVLTLGLAAEGETGPMLECLRQASFQAASITTTTGFATADTNIWPPACASALIAGSLICGCSGSTSGGMKVDRFTVAVKCLWARIQSMQSPNTVRRMKLEGRTIKEKPMNAVLIFLLSYILIVVTGAMINSSCGLDIKTAWTASIACMGNVGPGFGEVGSMSNFADLPLIVKYNSILLMLTGRLEIFPLLYVLGIQGRRGRA